jgi:hypothetical protein
LRKDAARARELVWRRSLGASKLPYDSIVLQSVKDVLKTLVDDDLVLFDKIGGKNFYWSFPSEVAIVVRMLASDPPWATIRAIRH